MPLTGNVAQDIRTEMAHGKPHKQAVAIALNVAKPSRRQRRKANKKKYATGGQYKVPGYQEGGIASNEPPNSVALIIMDEFGKRGLDGNFAVQVAQAESGLNPNAVGDGGRSHGIFQLYDGGLLQDFYAKGYTDPNDARQSAAYTADYISRNHDYGPWHAARSLFANGARPTDGSHYNDGTYSYGGGGSQPVGSSEPAQSGPDYRNFTREQWAFLAASQMGPKPSNYTDEQWQYMALAKGDQMRADYLASSPAPSNQGPYPTLPVTGNTTAQNVGTSPGQNANGMHVTIPGYGSGTLTFDANGGGAIRLDGTGQVIGLGLTGETTVDVLLDNGQTATVDRWNGAVYDASTIPDPNNPGHGLSNSSSSGGGGSSDYGPVQADILREQNRIDEERNQITLHLGDVQNQIDQIRAYTDASSQNRLRGLEEQKFQYQQALDKLTYQQNLLDYAADLRQQDVTLRGQDISVVMQQLDAEIQARGQDVTQRGQDLNAQLEGINQQIAYFRELRQDAIDRGDLAAKQDAENRMRVAMQASNDLVQREQDIAIRSQDINAAVQYGQLLEDQYRQQMDWAKYSGDYQLQAHAQEEQHAAQQQNARLQQFAAQLDANQQKLAAAKDETEAYTALAGMEQDWNKFLSNTLANPRDFAQYQYAVGGGRSFMDNLLAGQPFYGMTVGNINDIPTLGSNFDKLLQTLGDRPAWNAALESAGKIWERGGQVPEAPSWEEIAKLGEVSPLAPLPGMPEAPQLPNPMDMPRPDAVTFPDLPPLHDIPPAPAGPAAYTEADAARDMQQWMAEHKGATIAQVNAKRAELAARVGQQDWSHFNTTAPPVAPANTDVTLPPPPSSDMSSYIPPDVSPFPDNVPSAPDLANIAPGPTTPNVPTGGTGLPPSAPGTPLPGGGSPPPATNPPSSVPPPPVGTTSVIQPVGSAPPLSNIPYQPSIPPAARQHAEDINNAYQEWLRTHGHAQGGKEQLVTEPVTAYGDFSGEKKFTLGEQTNGFPQGIPETATVSPDGTQVDIEPFGQDRRSALTGLVEDAHKKLTAGEPPESVYKALFDAFHAIMQNSRETPDVQTAYAQKKKAQDYGMGDVSPPQAPAPDFMAGLMGDAKTVMQGKKKLMEAAMAARR